MTETETKQLIESLIRRIAVLEECIFIFRNHILTLIQSANVGQIQNNLRSIAHKMAIVEGKVFNDRKPISDLENIAVSKMESDLAEHEQNEDAYFASRGMF